MLMEFWMIILLYSGVFLLLFALAELLYHRFGAAAEHTRKLVHAGTGLLTLGFPLYFDSVFEVALICAAFFLVLAASLQYRLLPSINNVARVTAGTLLYPVIVVAVFWFYKFMYAAVPLVNALLFFYLPILIMAICDPIASLAGNWYKRRYGPAEGKTAFGSISFFISALVISFGIIAYFNPARLELWQSGYWAVIVAAATTLTERLSNKGWDNFTIPAATMAILYLMQTWS